MSYHTRWEAHADEALTVYVPVKTTCIADGSGIVGWPQDDRIEVCYEGNLYDIDDLRPYAERVRHAADRLVTGYPTIARAVLPEAALRPVGTYVLRTHTLTVTDPDALRAWLGEPDDQDQIA